MVKSLDCGARGPGFESRCRRMCWAVMELFVNVYLYEFILCSACVRFRFVKLRRWGVPSAVLHAVYTAAYDTHAKPCVMFGSTVCSKKSDAKIEITITATNLIRIKYPLSSCNYHLSGANIANFNKIHCTVFEQQLFK